MKNKRFYFDLKTKKDGKELYIEGYANRAAMDGKRVIDRGKEHIPSSEWKIDEWKKNPIIFFNHDRDFPIGKGVEARIDEGGLWIKAQISKSKDPAIGRVRDLIEEDILKTFSVGIDVESEEEVDGAIHLKGVNLLETSVVTIPMNQESFFSVSKKSLSEKSFSELARDITKAKGASLASAIHARIYELGNDEEFDRAAKLTEITQQAEISLDELHDVLSGNTIDVAEKTLAAISNVLGLPLEDLQVMVKADIAQADPNALNRPGEDNMEGEGDSESNGNDENEDDPDDKSKAQQTKEDSMQKCVSEHIRIGLEHGKTRDQAIAYALNECRNKTEGSCELSTDDWQKIISEFDNNKNLAPITTMPMGTATAADNGGNQLIAEMRQSNVLLGQLIGEIQRLSSLLTGNIQPVPNPQPVMQVSYSANNPDKIKNENDDIEEASKEILDNINEFKQKLEKRFKNLNV